MYNYRQVDDTICAVATPSGHGGISVIRVSGQKALTYCRKLADLPESVESHRAYYTNLRTLDNSKNIDEVLMTYFKQGKSFTGDETVEISCHGSPVISEEIIQNLIMAGCRLAERGEFTFRAFMSGRIDLLQAESILTLIQSETKRAAESSLRQLKGELSERIKEIQSKTTWVLAHLEANIDFAMEDLETLDNTEIKTRVDEVYQINSALLNSYKTGKVITDSLKVALVGEPNAGKSSLFNQLIKLDKAIVTDIPGTTRDVVEGDVIIEGVKVRFVDTAGLHETSDTVERIGIEKTRKQIEESDYIFYVIDTASKTLELDAELIEKFKDKIIVLGNKTDLPAADKNFSEKIKKIIDNETFLVSAKKHESLADVISFVESEIKKSFHESNTVVLKGRHFELLERMNQCFVRAKDLISDSASGEFIAFELRDALSGSLELLGEELDDQVMAKVFQEFCIGK